MVNFIWGAQGARLLNGGVAAPLRTAPVTDLVLWFVNVEDVDGALEAADDVVVPAHVRRQDAADHVLAKPAKLLRCQVVEGVGARVLQQLEGKGAVMAFQWSDVVIAVGERCAGANLNSQQAVFIPFQ